MWPLCPHACQGWQVARHLRGHAVRAGMGEAVWQREIQLCLRGGWERSAIGTLAPTRGTQSVFGQVAADLVCMSLESAVQRPSAKQALEEERQWFIEAAQE